MNPKSLNAKVSEIYTTVSRLSERCDDYMSDKSDAWHDSDAGREYQAILDALNECVDALSQVVIL